MRKKHLEGATEFLCDSVSGSDLEGVLAEQGVLLVLQPEILRLSPKLRERRLAEFVVNLLGDGLLANKILRERLCQSKGILSPKSWKPGSRTAFELVRNLGLDERFAGTLNTSRQPPYEEVSRTVPEAQLESYQLEVFDKAKALLQTQNSLLISLPTGGGKTLVAMKLMRALMLGSPSGHTTSIWIAHTDELCEQAVQCALDVFRYIEEDVRVGVFRFWGAHARQLGNGERYEGAWLDQATRRLRIIVSTPGAALRLFDHDQQGTLGAAIDSLSFLFVDEAHRAAAETYRKLIRSAERVQPARKLIGLSATPVRETYASEPYQGTRALASIFGTLVEPDKSLGTADSPVEALQSLGVLAELEFYDLNVKMGDCKALAEAIADTLKSKGTLRPCLVFNRTVAESKVLAMMLRELGLAAEHVSADTSPTDRLAIATMLKNAQLDVVCNCEILTTGFDAPKIGSIFLARSTNSPVLYKQMIGRGLRGPKFGGSRACSVYLCGIQLPFAANPNTTQFAREIWGMA